MLVVSFLSKLAAAAWNLFFAHCLCLFYQKVHACTEEAG